MNDSFLPQVGDLTLSALPSQMPNRTYKMDSARKVIVGYTDGIEALEQTVRHILSVERYRYPIYSYSYGVELEDLIGKPSDFAMTEVKRRITDALSQDDRIVYLDDWSFQRSEKGLFVGFVVHSIFGNLDVTKELVI